mgnify:CR=1 FL=1
MATVNATGNNGVVSTGTNTNFDAKTTTGDDVIYCNGYTGLDISADDGNDTVVGFTSGTSVDGGNGEDFIFLLSGNNANDFNNAQDGDISKVEVIDAFVSSGGVLINLSKQNEGLKVIGSFYNDTIIGFDSVDSVNGGEGVDTLKVQNSSEASVLSAAPDTQITGIENIDLSSSVFGLSINLGNQNEGFTIIGSFQGDTINGSEGDDVIIGFKGADVINGGGGKNRLLLSSTSTDLNNATDGQVSKIQVVDLSGAVAVGVEVNLKNQLEDFLIIGSDKADTIVGGKGNDTILGFSVGDKVDGGDGVDRIDITDTSIGLNNAGDDAIQGIEGIAAVDALSGVEIKLSSQTEGFIVAGSSYDDTIVGSSGKDTIFSGSGNDKVNAGGGNDLIVGGDGEDTILGGSGNDEIFGEDGNDIINGELGKDTIFGQEGDDSINGGSEDDVLLGGDGEDTILGGSGKDTIFGQEGDDNINGELGDDVLLGGDGEDTILGGLGEDEIFGEGGDDSINGESEDDVLLGGDGEDTILGGSGKDTIFGQEGDDNINGELGDDVLLGGDGEDTILGGLGEDVLFGGDGSDTIFGGLGKDAIFGQGGNDVIISDFTEDVLVGGLGSDRFVFSTGLAFSPSTAKVDLIVDFQSGDVIVLSKTTFTALTASSGNLSSGGTPLTTTEFAVISGGGATVASSSSALIVYDLSTGTLYYNPNGSAAGFGDGGAFAVVGNGLTGAAALTASDILVIP